MQDLRRLVLGVSCKQEFCWFEKANINLLMDKGFHVDPFLSSTSPPPWTKPGTSTLGGKAKLTFSMVRRNRNCEVFCSNLGKGKMTA